MRDTELARERLEQAASAADHVLASHREMPQVRTSAEWSLTFIGKLTRLIGAAGDYLLATEPARSDP